MPTGTQSDTADETSTVSQSRPEIAVCESSPGKAVFLEAGNTDGWIASDLTIDVTR